jgi:ABC-type antimicrobial peptide transport system permease subunit
VKTLTEQVDESIFQERLLATLSGFFGVLALLIVCIGLYGLMSYVVTRRTAEFGIRIALGAQRDHVLWLVLRETLIILLFGVGIGLPAALALSRIVRSMLFGLTPHDPVTLTGAAALLVAVACLAGYLPARRASHVDPMIYIRA